MTEPTGSGAMTAFVHIAELKVTAGADPRAPGGAITVALCGAVDHQPPCPLAAHYTGVEQAETHLELRILFATAARGEARVRDLIRGALQAGEAGRVRPRPAPPGLDRDDVATAGVRRTRVLSSETLDRL